MTARLRSAGEIADIDVHILAVVGLCAVGKPYARWHVVAPGVGVEPNSRHRAIVSAGDPGAPRRRRDRSPRAASDATAHRISPCNRGHPEVRRLTTQRDRVIGGCAPDAPRLSALAARRFIRVVRERHQRWSGNQRKRSGAPSLTPPSSSWISCSCMPCCNVDRPSWDTQPSLHSRQRPRRAIAYRPDATTVAGQLHRPPPCLTYERRSAETGGVTVDVERKTGAARRGGGIYKRP